MRNIEISLFYRAGWGKKSYTLQITSTKDAYMLIYSLQYLNSGAGGLAAAYIHEKHSQSIQPA